MAVRERSPLDFLRERFAELLRSFADLVAPARDRVARILDGAPDDDEGLSVEEAAAIKKGWEDYRAGEARPLDEIKRELD